MPFFVFVALAVLSIVVLAIAVVDTARVQARRGNDPAVSLTYRAYGA